MFGKAKQLIIRSALIMAIAMPVFATIDITSAEAGSRTFRRAAVAAGIITGGIIAVDSFRRYRRGGYYNYGYRNYGYRAGAYYRPAYRPVRRVYRRAVRRAVRRGYYHYNHYHNYGYHRHRH